jgi:hypothetical protein
MIEINNIKIPTPSAFKVGIMDISKAERNAKGEMLIDRIATKRKLDLSWSYLEADELSRLLQLINNVYFFVRYPDPMTGNIVIKTFYVGDRNVGMYAYNKGQPRWNDISFNFIEK